MTSSFILFLHNALLPIILIIIFLLFLIALWFWKNKNIFTIIKIKNEIKKNHKKNFIKIKEDSKDEKKNEIQSDFIRSIKTIFTENQNKDISIFSSSLFLKMHYFFLNCTSKNDFIKNSIKNFCFFCPGQSIILYWMEKNNDVFEKKIFFSLKKDKKNPLPLTYEKNIMKEYGKESTALKKPYYLIEIENETYLSIPLFFCENHESKSKIGGILRISLQKDKKNIPSEEEIKKISTLFLRISFFYSHMLSHYYRFKDNILATPFLSVNYFKHLVKTLKKMHNHMHVHLLPWNLTTISIKINSLNEESIYIGKIKLFGKKLEENENISFRLCLFSQKPNSITLLGLLQKNNENTFAFSHTEEKINKYLTECEITETKNLSTKIKFFSFEKLCEMITKPKKLS